MANLSPEDLMQQENPLITTRIYIYILYIYMKLYNYMFEFFSFISNHSLHSNTFAIYILNNKNVI